MMTDINRPERDTGNGDNVGIETKTVREWIYIRGKTPVQLRKWDRSFSICAKNSHEDKWTDFYIGDDLYSLDGDNTLELVMELESLVDPVKIGHMSDFIFQQLTEPQKPYKNLYIAQIIRFNLCEWCDNKEQFVIMNIHTNVGTHSFCLEIIEARALLERLEYVPIIHSMTYLQYLEQKKRVRNSKLAKGSV